jgi:RNA-directed DNA polymerase
VRKPLREVIKYLNPILRGWSEYYRWLNSAQHLREVDKYIVFKLRRWLRRKQQRTRLVTAVIRTDRRAAFTPHF